MLGTCISLRRRSLSHPGVGTKAKSISWIKKIDKGGNQARLCWTRVKSPCQAHWLTCDVELYVYLIQRKTVKSIIKKQNKSNQVTLYVEPKKAWQDDLACYLSKGTFTVTLWFDLHFAAQKQLKEMLESHRLRKTDFINNIRRDKDKMDTIKVHSAWDSRDRCT